MKLQLKARRAIIDPIQVVLFAVVVLMVTLVGFLVIGKLESSMTLSTKWNQTYTNFVTQVQTIFPLIGVLLIVIVSVAIIAVIISTFRGGGEY